jgi:hypothetical protein
MAELSDYSEVTLANAALQLIGRGKFIVSLDEDSQAARIMRAALPVGRDAVLRAYPWNFAQGRAELTNDEVGPTFEFTYSYTLPTDCLWCHTVYEGNDQDWKVEGRKILTDMGSPIYIKYTKRITDLSASDPLFFDAVAARLAAQCAVSLSESTSKAAELWRMYQLKLREARAVDAQEGQAEAMPRGSWHDGRLANEFPPYSDWRG